MKLLMTAATAALLLLGVGAAGAQDAPGGGGAANPMRAKMREMCAADIQKYCADKTGRDRMMCMRDNLDKISDGCKSAMAEMRAARQAAGGGAAPQR